MDKGLRKKRGGRFLQTITMIGFGEVRAWGEDPLTVLGWAISLAQVSPLFIAGTVVGKASFCREGTGKWGLTKERLTGGCGFGVDI